MSDNSKHEILDEENGDVAEYLGSTINHLNSVSSDSASTFEYVEKNLSPEKPWDFTNEHDNFSPIETIDHDDLQVSSRIVTCFSSKEEKQRQNEEIAEMETVSESWESVPTRQDAEDAKESCRLFLRNERCFGIGIDGPVRSSSSSSKPCFIDASSLLDEEDLIYTPPPSVCHKTYSVVNQTQLQKSFELEDGDDQLLPKNHDIKDQYSALEKPVNSSKKFLHEENGSSRENEKHQGNLIFQHAIPQFSGHLIKHSEDNYTSDLSIYSSTSGEPREQNDFANSTSRFNSLGENASDGYNSGCNSAGYSRIHSDNDSSIVLPETPFNSIIQVARQLKIYEACDFVDGEEKDEQMGKISYPIKIPRRSMKYDEFAPVLSGGVSVKDFTPKQCESPSTKRRTDTCPILSGGSVDFEDEKPKEVRRPSTSTTSHSWVVDFNELKIREDDEKIDRQPKSLDYSSGQNNSLGFYVDFNSLKNVEKKSVESKPNSSVREDEKRSTGFFVDFSDSSRPETPKHVQVPSVKSKAAASDKKNMFSMFIDLSDEDKKMKAPEVVEETIKEESPSKVDEKSPKEDKKGCYMFIESDSPVVKRRANVISKNETKRHSWNVNPQEGPTEAQRSAKTYQRSTSVSNEKGSINILEKLPILSKTSSMSIDSSVSPYEDFSCSKSFSSYSNNSVTTSNSSIDHSGTKILLDENIMTQSAKKRRKDAKLNETFDKSSQGSITEGILSNDDSQADTSTDTDDVTFQNNEQEEILAHEMRMEHSNGDFKSKIMETIPETTESSPLKKLVLKIDEEEKETDLKIETHTMESLQALIEKQKQILENTAEPTSVSFVRLSDLDKPPPPQKHCDNSTASNSTKVSRLFHENSGHRSLTLQNDTRHSNNWNMSRSTGNNLTNLASSVENSRSISRLFPHLSKVISSSVPSHVGCSISEQSYYDHLEFVSSDFSCTSSSVTSSRSGMDSADESSMSYRQPRRLGEDLLKMFLQEIATDVSIEVGPRKMRAHKCILRSRCQYFAAILAGNFVSHAGNVISLPGYSYSAVHFALCHIYSGASHPPEGISLMELASLSDLLGLEGLKEVTAYALKTNYCHSFHKPCSGCIDGILQVFPVTLNHGLDDLYRRCLKWVCKHYNKVWLSRPFAQLPSDLLVRCRQQIAAHLTSENVLNWILECEDLLKQMAQCRWNVISVENLIRDILDSAHSYVMDHFASLIASDSFLSLGHGENYTISRLENLLLRTASALTPDQACRSYPRAVRLNQLLTAKVILPNPLSNESLQIMDRVNTIQLRQEDQAMGWNGDFIHLVSALMSAIEQCLIRQCARAMRCSSWQRMDADLRMKMQKLACLSDTEDLRKLRSSASSFSSIRNYSATSSVSSRSNDLRQVKLAIQAHSRKIHGGPPVENSNIPVIKKNLAKPITNGHPVTKSATRTNVPEKLKPVHKRSHSEEATSVSKSKLVTIKSRYMEPKKPKTPVMEKASNRLQVKVKNISSSESSTRGSSPAFNRRQNIGVRKASNLSLDSLQHSPSKQKLQLVKPKASNMEISIDSLAESMKSSMKTISSESLVRRGRNLTDETKLMKCESKGKISDIRNSKQMSQLSPQVRPSFLSQKSREILAKRASEGKNRNERKFSTNSNSSITKSTNSTPKLIEINKSSSAISLECKKKVFNTTLHLRKSATVSDSEGKKTSATNKNVKPGSAKSLKSPQTSKKSELTTKNEKKIIPVKKSAAPLAKEEEIEAAMKMARSNTFSKETSDNPLELLKIID